MKAMPTECTKRPYGALVSEHVAVNFCSPILFIRFRESAILAFMAVPKTSMDEYCAVQAQQDNIWLARKTVMRAGIAKPCGPQLAFDIYLGKSVSTLDPCHNLTTLLH